MYQPSTVRDPNAGLYGSPAMLARFRRQQQERVASAAQAAESDYAEFVIEVPSLIRAETARLALLWKNHRTELCDCSGMKASLVSHEFRILDNLAIVPAFEGEPTEAIVATAFTYCPHCGVVIDPDA